MGHSCSSGPRVRSAGDPTPSTNAASHNDSVKISTYLRDDQQQQLRKENDVVSTEVSGFMMGPSAHTLNDSMPNTFARNKRLNDVLNINGQSNDVSLLKNTDEGLLGSPLPAMSPQLGDTPIFPMPAVDTGDTAFLTARSLPDSFHSIPYRHPIRYAFPAESSVGSAFEPFAASEAFASCRSASIPLSVTASARQTVGSTYSFILPLPLPLHPPSGSASEAAFHSCVSVYTRESTRTQKGCGRYTPRKPYTTFSHTSVRTNTSRPVVPARGGASNFTTSITSIRSTIGEARKGDGVAGKRASECNGSLLSERSINTTRRYPIKGAERRQSDVRDTELDEDSLFHSFATATDDFVLGDTSSQSCTSRHQERGMLACQLTLPPPRLQLSFSRPSVSHLEESLAFPSQASLSKVDTPRPERRSTNSVRTTGVLTPASTHDGKKLATSRAIRKSSCTRVSAASRLMRSRSQPASNTLRVPQETGKFFLPDNDLLLLTKSRLKRNASIPPKGKGPAKETREETESPEQDQKQSAKNPSLSKLDQSASLISLAEGEEEDNVDMQREAKGGSEEAVNTLVSNAPCNRDDTAAPSPAESKAASRLSLTKHDSGEANYFWRVLSSIASLPAARDGWHNANRNETKNRNEREMQKEEAVEEVTLLQHQQEAFPRGDDDNDERKNERELFPPEEPEEAHVDNTGSQEGKYREEHEEDPRGSSENEHAKEERSAVFYEAASGNGGIAFLGSLTKPGIMKILSNGNLSPRSTSALHDVEGSNSNTSYHSNSCKGINDTDNGGVATTDWMDGVSVGSRQSNIFVVPGGEASTSRQDESGGKLTPVV